MRAHRWLAVPSPRGCRWWAGQLNLRFLVLLVGQAMSGWAVPTMVGLWSLGCRATATMWEPTCLHGW